MNVSEIPKNGADIARGRILLAIEGLACDVQAITEGLKQQGWKYSDCEEEGERAGDLVGFWCIDRSEKQDFIADYKNEKAKLTTLRAGNEK